MSEYRSLQNVAYDHLRQMIYSRELEFDVIYSETRLAAQLSISRTPMRDALNRLNRERYIDILPNKGFRLHKPDAQEVREAYHVRRMIEGYCGENLASDAQTKEGRAAIQRMQGCLDRQMALLDREDAVDIRRFWMEDQEFHLVPLHYLNISTFSLQYDSFLHIFMPQHLKNDYVLGRSHSTIAEHRAIVEALTAGDVEATKSAIEKHLNTTLRILMLTINGKPVE